MKNKNAGCVYGYVRVSSADQNEERQRIAMAQEGLKEKDIFMDKQSGKDFDRPAYRRLLHVLREGDILVVKSIDRLGRDYEEIIEQWRCRCCPLLRKTREKTFAKGKERASTQHWHEACTSADRGFRTVRRCWRLCGCTGKKRSRLAGHWI